MLVSGQVRSHAGERRKKSSPAQGSRRQSTMAATAGVDSVLQECQQRQRPDGTAAVLAIGTANPANCLHQDEYPDWYFRVTKSDHLTTLKNKMKRICTDDDY
jgi:hypothetical protein